MGNERILKELDRWYYAGSTRSHEAFTKGDKLAKLITPYALSKIIEFANEIVKVFTIRSLEELVDRRHKLTEREFDLARNALRERGWVCVIHREPMRPKAGTHVFEGLVMEAMPGFDHKAQMVIPVQYVEVSRQPFGSIH